MATNIQEVNVLTIVNVQFVEQLKTQVALVAAAKAVNCWDLFEALKNTLDRLPSAERGINKKYTIGELYDAYVQAEKVKLFHMCMDSRAESILDEFVHTMRGAIMTYVVDADSSFIITCLYSYLNECSAKSQVGFGVLEAYIRDKHNMDSGKKCMGNAVINSAVMYIFPIVQRLILKQYNDIKAAEKAAQKIIVPAPIKSIHFAS